MWQYLIQPIAEEAQSVVAGWYASSDNWNAVYKHDILLPWIFDFMGNRFEERNIDTRSVNTNKLNMSIDGSMNDRRSIPYIPT